MLAPQATMHACCVDARAALAALALLLLLVLALLLLFLLMLSLLLRRLQCSTLSRLTRFPFHDSQVYFWSQKAWYLQCFSHFLRKKGPPLPAPFREASGEPLWNLPGHSQRLPGAPREPQESPKSRQKRPRRAPGEARGGPGVPGEPPEASRRPPCIFCPFYW